MRILLIADGRSPTTRRWAEMLASLGMTLGLVSTYPCSPLDCIEFFEVLPVAFASLAAARSNTSLPDRVRGPASSSPGAQAGGVEPRSTAGLKPVVARFRGVFLAGRYSLGPLTIRPARAAYLRCLNRFQPDLVHALRIPFEGMLASYTPPGLPLLVSIWGNDLTLHARASRSMAGLTRRTLARADGLLADTRRDLRLARSWGLPKDAPALAVPGSGGIRLDEIRSRTGPVDDLFPGPLPDEAEIVVNARGFRPGSVRNETFFAAAPGLLAARPRLVLVCPAMAGQPPAEHWAAEMQAAGYGGRVFLLPALPQPRLWDLFHHAQVFVSPSAHDGTPNSLLEAMACGLFPVLGDIESMREWITPGVNGLLVDPDDPAALADSIALALDHPFLRARAADHNLAIVRERADVEKVKLLIDKLYRTLTAATRRTE